MNLEISEFKSVYSCVEFAKLCKTIMLFVFNTWLDQKEQIEICSLIFNQFKLKDIIIYIWRANDFNVGNKAYLQQRRDWGWQEECRQDLN